MEVEDYKMPDDLYYHQEYMWCRVEGDTATVGLIDFAQQLAGDISFVEMPFEGDEVTQDEEVGTVETGKWVGKIFAPVSGSIEATNESIYDDPAVINEDPYGEGWIFKVSMSDEEELENLMGVEEAAEWLKGEIEKHA